MVEIVVEDTTFVKIFFKVGVLLPDSLLFAHITMKMIVFRNVVNVHVEIVLGLIF